MRLTKFAIAVAGATVLLGAFVSTASAGRLSVTTRSINTSWTRLDFVGWLANVECEVIINGTGHSNTIAKSPGALMGFITAANVTRCARFSASILKETLPWHRQYDSFAGTLPNIASIRVRIIGLSMRWQEPFFGLSCLIRSSAAAPAFVISNRNTATGAITSASIGGSTRCQENDMTGTLEGTSSSITAHTVTLI